MTFRTSRTRGKLRRQVIIYRSPQLFSDCEQYEYTFRRVWDRNKPTALWVMLNPSLVTSDPGELVTPSDGRTIARCESFSRRVGCGSLVTGNIFAYRATKPADLALCAEPVGPDNDAILHMLVDQASIVIAAWGSSFPSRYAGRVSEVRDKLRTKGAQCLGKTSDGHPRHPLYVRGDAQPITL